MMLRHAKEVIRSVIAGNGAQLAKVKPGKIKKVRGDAAVEGGRGGRVGGGGGGGKGGIGGGEEV